VITIRSASADAANRSNTKPRGSGVKLWTGWYPDAVPSQTT
jgi:hypothetical protein